MNPLRSPKDARNSADAKSVRQADGEERGAIPSSHGLADRLMRAAWGGVWLVAFRPTPRFCHGWRRWILKRMGAKIGRGAAIHPSVQIWAPWNLEMGDFAAIGPHVDCYSVDKVTLGPGSVVSQYVHLCTATHDYTSRDLPLRTAPIVVGKEAWICTGAFLGPGVQVGEGAVVGARSAVHKGAVKPWTVVGGNPARFLKERRLTVGE